MLPIALRNQVSPVLKDGFFIKKSFYSECLELYPAQEWHTVMAELNQQSRYDPGHLNFMRIYTAGLRQVEVDSTGRLLIPKSIISMAGISKEVVIAPMGKYLEIWDKALYDTSISASNEEKQAMARHMIPGGKPKEDGGKPKEDVS